LNTIALIDAALLDSVSRQAAALPRLRKNHNFHASDDYPCNRLLNAIEPGSYVRPHCHADAGKDETLVVLRGRIGVLEFDASGAVTGSAVLRPGGEAMGVDVPHGTFHSVLALAPGTVFLEAKAGPYAPLRSCELPPWAPEEGSADVPRYYAWMRTYFD